MGTDGATRRPAAVRLAGRAGRVLAGGAGLAVRALTPGTLGTLGTRTPDGLAAPPPPSEDNDHQTAIVQVAAVRLGEAALGVAALTSRRVLDVAAGVAMPVEAAAAIVVRAGGAVAGRTGLARRIDGLARVGREEQRRNERAAALLLRSAWRRSVDRVVAETDLDAVVDAVLAEVDVNGVVRRVDLDAIVSRVDVDAVVARVDLNAVVDRLGVPDLVERVLDDIDLSRIVRESSAGMAAETVDAVRVRSAGADRAINGFVDRVVLRRPPRNGARVPPGPADGTGRAPP